MNKDELKKAIEQYGQLMFFYGESLMMDNNSSPKCTLDEWTIIREDCLAKGKGLLQTIHKMIDSL